LNDTRLFFNAKIPLPMTKKSTPVTDSTLDVKNVQKSKLQLTRWFRSASPQTRAGLVLGSLALIAVGAAQLLVMTAVSLGGHGVLAPVAAFLPVEQITLLDRFRVSDRQLVTDAVLWQFDPDQNAKLGGREFLTQTKLEVTGEAASASSAYTLQTQLTARVAMAANSEVTKSTYKMTGKFDAGVFAMSSGDEGWEMEILSENANQFYGKLHLSRELKNTLKMATGAYATQSPEAPNFEEYLDTYFSVNVSEFQAMQAEMDKRRQELFSGNKTLQAEIPDPEVMKQAQQELWAALRPDLEALSKKTITDLSNQTTITRLDREKVGERAALVYELQLDRQVLADAGIEGVKELHQLLKKHQDAFQKYCEAVTTPHIYNDQCQASLGTLQSQLDQWELSLNDPSLVQKDMVGPAAFTKELREMIALVSMKDVRVYVDAVDGSLLKTAFVLEVNPQAFHDKFQAELTQARLSVSSEEVSRGKDFTVTRPEGTKDLTELVRREQEKQLEQLEQVFKKNK
jgi:hypothetical protein